MQLYNDDCLNILPTLENESIDLIIADPPYFNVVNQQWDKQWASKAVYLSWCNKWIQHCYRLLKSSGSFYLWGGVGEKSDTIIHQKLIADDIGFHFKDWITWQKSRGMGNRRGWMYTREECLWFVKDNKQFIWNEAHQYDIDRPSNRKDLGYNSKPRKSQYKRHTNIWQDNSDQSYSEQRFHYTPKPEKLIERIILAHSTPDMVILDPFLGSGTTCKVAKLLGYQSIGIEKDETYFKLARDRISLVT